VPVCLPVIFVPIQVIFEAVVSIWYSLPSGFATGNTSLTSADCATGGFSQAASSRLAVVMFINQKFFGTFYLG
jgi:hypothetical protein